MTTNANQTADLEARRPETADERFRREFPGATEVFDLLESGGSGAGSTVELDEVCFICRRNSVNHGLQAHTFITDEHKRTMEELQQTRADLAQARAREKKLEKVVTAFQAYDRLIQAWGAQITDGNQHIGDNAELDEAYAVILEAIDHTALDAQQAAGGTSQ